MREKLMSLLLTLLLSLYFNSVTQVEEHITKYTKSRPTDEQLVQIIKTTEDIKTASRQCEENVSQHTHKKTHTVKCT